VLLAALWLAGYEVFWRTRNFVPTLVDNEALWCNQRSRVAPDAVVIAGSSRLQNGLDPALLARDLGRPVSLLALAGSNPMPVLLDVANDPSFHGLVVLEYMPRRLFAADSWSHHRSNTFLAACRDPSLAAGIEAALGRTLQRRLVFLQPDLEAIAVLSYVARKRALPAGTHVIVRDDRFAEGHLANVVKTTAQPATATEHWDAALTDAELAARGTQLRLAIAKLRARGGEVVLYRSPVSGAVLADEEARFPAATSLPRFARLLGVRAIDFAAVPALRDVMCPDGEHPDVEQVGEITKAVAAELQRM
jgi:hypothetical protein